MQEKPLVFGTSYFIKLIVIVLVLIVILISGLSLVSYYNTKSVLQDQFFEDIDQSRLYLANNLMLIKSAEMIYDSKYDYELKKASEVFLEEYIRSDGDPAMIDLESLKTRLSDQLGGDVDLFIINSGGFVEYTTYPADLGLDFSEITPDFYESLTKIREGDEFVADTRVKSINDPSRKFKYTYMPTPDHMYILELGSTNPPLEEGPVVLSYYNIVEEQIKLNPAIVTIEFYDLLFDSVIFTSEDEKPLGLTYYDQIIEVRQSRQDMRIVDPSGNSIIDIYYFDLLADDLPSGNTLNVVALAEYSTDTLAERIDNARMNSLLISLLMIMVVLLIIYGLFRYVKKPVDEIIDDIEIIAAGDLDHKIKKTEGFEFERLEDSINTMVSRIKEDMKDITEKSDELDHELMERKRVEIALKATNEKLNLLASVTRHDIKNQIFAISGYCELLMDSVDDKNGSQEYLDKIRDKVRVITEQIDFTSMYQDMGTKEPKWQNLLESVGKAKKGIIGAEIICESCNVDILADILFVRALFNLFENSFRHGGEVSRISVSFEEDKSGKGRIIVEDNGAGIHVVDKERIFEKGYGEHTGYGLFLIRHILGITGMEIEENGVYGKGARFEITVPEGCFRVTGEKSKKSY